MAGLAVLDGARAALEEGAGLDPVKGRNLVLLEGAHCEGADVPWTQGCQRLCFYFWRTEWLEKVEGWAPSLDGRAAALVRGRFDNGAGGERALLSKRQRCLRPPTRSSLSPSI